jgi:hypothetical protein
MPLKPGSLAFTVSLTLAVATGCGATTAEPSPTVTVTQTATVTAPPPEPGAPSSVVDPLIETAVTDACAYLDGNEPSWDSLTEVGPYEDIPMDVEAVLRYAKQADEAYRGAYERLDPLNLYQRGSMAYGMVLADIDARAGLASALRFRAKEYLKTGQDYDSLYYFWAAYTASVESQVSPCADYTG